LIDHDQPANDKQAYIFIAVTGLVIYFLSAEVPRFADDYCRAIPSFLLVDFPGLLLSEYENWTGRIPTIALTYLAMSTEYGLFWFHLLNGVAVSAMLVVVWRQLAHLNHIQRMACLFLGCSLLWFAPHRLGEVMLWKSGAIGYLWGCVLALVVVHLFWSRLGLHIRASQNPSPRLGAEVLIAILSLIAAAWLEHLSIAIFAAMTLMFAWFQRFRGPIPRGAWLVFAGWAMGMLFLIAAPGNYVRASQIGYVDDLPLRLLHVISVSWHQLTPLMFLTVAYAVTAIVAGYLRFRQVSLVLFPLLLALIAGLTLVALAAAPSPAVVGRALFPFEFFMIMAALMVTGNLLAARNNEGASWQSSAIHPSVVIGGSLCLLVTLVDLTHAGLTYHELNLQNTQRDELLRASPARLASTTDDRPAITLPPLRVRAGLFHDEHSSRDGSRVAGRIYIRDITPDPAHWRNRCFADAQGISSVILDRSANL
tara:strand:- start:13463 stop:14902 length:1440 start_codon:yes stop_codon:yes gene_type:complete